MHLEERAELAAQKKARGECNCCQAVLISLSDQTGLTEEQVMSAGSGFAVGMGDMEATCGALVGAVLAAGMKLGGRGTVRYARQMSESFRSRCGASLCCELKGKGTGIPLCACEDCVRNAVLCYGDIIGIA